MAITKISNLDYRFENLETDQAIDISYTYTYIVSYTYIHVSYTYIAIWYRQEV